MTMNISDKPPGLSPEGFHIARCFGFIHLGTIFIYGHWKQMIRLEFELPNECRVFKQGENEKPKVVTREYAASLYGKSHLKTHLISWFGEEFVNIFSQNFDISMLLGAPCLLRLSHKRSSTNKWYEEIEELHAVRDTDDVPDPINPIRSLVLNEQEFDARVFNELPKFIQEKIKGSQEYMKMFSTPVNH